jgi:hypothetical protein
MGQTNEAAPVLTGPGNEAAPLRTASVSQDQRHYGLRQSGLTKGEDIFQYISAGQSGLNFAVRPDTREGCHYISASKTYLD